MSRARRTRLPSLPFATAALLAYLIAFAPWQVATAQEAALLIRNATVHTVTDQGTLQGTDLLVQAGRIAAIGPGVSAPPGARVIDAEGRPVTPGLFAGYSALGVEETWPGASDAALHLNQMRPEFDVTLAYNPDSAVIGVNRIEGFTFTLVAPVASVADAGTPGSFIAGQGGVMKLSGQLDPISRALFIDFGAAAAGLSGNSRAAQFMLLRQALTEARTPNLVLAHDQRLLTSAGRQTLLDYLNGAGRIVIDVDRAADIRRVLAFAQREALPLVVSGAGEGWRVAREIAAAGVPVLIDPLQNLPADFDVIGATLENAARLHAAGVTVVFTQRVSEPHNVRRLRQAAGNAVAHGMPWDAALAALTRHPAEAFGNAEQTGVLAVGRPADLVLWSGDPLEVTSAAELVLIEGVAQPQRSRQTDLRDRHLQRLLQGKAR